MEPKEVVLKFIEEINAHNLDGLCALMSEDHQFVDALGSIVQGREQMRKGWVGYFQMVPDYRITCEEIIERGDVVAAFGTAGGTYTPDGTLLDENKWNVPAAWHATVADGLVSVWRVYTDNEPIRQLIAKADQPGRRTRQAD
jgi:ketosteroid isomerase-like protein